MLHRKWHFSPLILGICHENGSNWAGVLCLPLSEYIVEAFSGCDHSPPLKTSTLHWLHLHKHFGCLAPESALTFLWKSQFYCYESCTAANYVSERTVITLFFDTSGTWNSKDDSPPTGTQKGISQTTAKSASVGSQVFLSPWFACTTKVTSGSLQKRWHYGVFTADCSPDTRHVVLEKGYRKVGSH